jgi:hypothetical protein
MKCSSMDSNGNLDGDVDMMRCLVLNCIAGLRIAEIEKSEKNGSKIDEDELVKKKFLLQPFR